MWPDLDESRHEQKLKEMESELMTKSTQKETGGGNAPRSNAAEIEYQLAMINRILTVWYDIENAEPIFGEVE